MVSPEEPQDRYQMPIIQPSVINVPQGDSGWETTGCWPQIAEVHIKGKISVSPDSCIFPYIASGGDGIPVRLFQILKDDVVKVLHSICQQIWNTQQWPCNWKRSVFIPILKKGNVKECSNYLTIASKVMLKMSITRWVMQTHLTC